MRKVLLSAATLLFIGLISAVVIFWLVHHGFGRHGRVSTPPKFHAQVQVDPAVYDAYVGKFDLTSEKSVMTITREGDHLFEQITDRPRREIFPESTEKYFLKDVDAEITFLKDAEGHFDALALEQFGETIAGKRMR